jgi:hypothetical protein
MLVGTVAEHASLILIVNTASIIAGQCMPTIAAANHSRRNVITQHPAAAAAREAFVAVLPNSWHGKRVDNRAAIIVPNAMVKVNIALPFTRTCAIATMMAECCFAEDARIRECLTLKHENEEHKIIER